MSILGCVGSTVVRISWPLMSELPQIYGGSVSSKVEIVFHCMTALWLMHVLDGCSAANEGPFLIQVPAVTFSRITINYVVIHVLWSLRVQTGEADPECLHYGHAETQDQQDEQTLRTSQQGEVSFFLMSVFSTLFLILHFMITNNCIQGLLPHQVQCIMRLCFLLCVWIDKSGAMNDSNIKLFSVLAVSYLFTTCKTKKLKPFLYSKC